MHLSMVTELHPSHSRNSAIQVIHGLQYILFKSIQNSSKMTFFKFERHFTPCSHNFLVLAGTEVIPTLDIETYLLKITIHRMTRNLSL